MRSSKDQRTSKTKKTKEPRTKDQWTRAGQMSYLGLKLTYGFLLKDGHEKFMKVMIFFFRWQGEG